MVKNALNAMRQLILEFQIFVGDAVMEASEFVFLLLLRCITMSDQSEMPARHAKFPNNPKFYTDLLDSLG